jgi:hypothetical protein
MNSPRNSPVTERPPHVIGPLGEMLTLETLPSPQTKRWTPHRKAEVVAAIHGGLLSFDEARVRYSLEMDELIGWQRALHRSGIPGLRITRLQHYRDLYERRDRY